MVPTRFGGLCIRANRLQLRESSGKPLDVVAMKLRFPVISCEFTGKEPNRCQFFTKDRQNYLHRGGVNVTLNLSTRARVSGGEEKSRASGKGFQKKTIKRLQAGIKFDRLADVATTSRRRE